VTEGSRFPRLDRAATISTSKEKLSILEELNSKLKRLNCRSKSKKSQFKKKYGPSPYLENQNKLISKFGARNKSVENNTLRRRKNSRGNTSKHHNPGFTITRKEKTLANGNVNYINKVSKRNLSVDPDIFSRRNYSFDGNSLTSIKSHKIKNIDVSSLRDKIVKNNEFAIQLNRSFCGVSKEESYSKQINQEDDSLVQIDIGGTERHRVERNCLKDIEIPEPFELSFKSSTEFYSETEDPY